MTVTSRERQLVTVTNHVPQASASTLAELALITIIERDRIVLAEREAAAAAAKKEEMRLNMRARALERAAAKRKLRSQPVVSPTKQPRRTNHVS
jgi:hypothetical protein